VNKKHQLQFPVGETHDIAQNEVYFYLQEGEDRVKLRFHDYDEIYRRPGLYEQIFYERLKCDSPKKVGQILHSALTTSGSNISELRVLDLGAGNGIMGEVLKTFGVARTVGVDILPEAKTAAYRDRPWVYDEYFITDLTEMSDQTKTEMQDWSFNCLTSVAALGFGDIPPLAFVNALNLVQDNGWVAFNIKETFLDNRDKSGFSQFIRSLILSDFFEVFHLEKYRHRLSMEGTPLYYFALVGRKKSDVPLEVFG